HRRPLAARILRVSDRLQRLPCLPPRRRWQGPAGPGRHGIGGTIAAPAPPPRRVLSLACPRPLFTAWHQPRDTTCSKPPSRGGPALLSKYLASPQAAAEAARSGKPAPMSRPPPTDPPALSSWPAASTFFTASVARLTAHREVGYAWDLGAAIDAWVRSAIPPMLVPLITRHPTLSRNRRYRSNGRNHASPARYGASKREQVPLSSRLRANEHASLAVCYQAALAPLRAGS